MAGSTVTAVTFPRDAGLGITSVKRGLKGAAGGIFVGPVLSKAAIEGPTTITHATAAAAGGVEDSTGSRESDTYKADASTGGLTGGASTTVTRPTGRTAFIGDGVQGGSTGGDPIDSTGRAEVTGTDRFGRAYSSDIFFPSGPGKYDYTNFDGRSTLDGEGGRALGGAGRGTTVDVETVTVRQNRPATDAVNEASGTVAIVDAVGKIVTAIHTDDIPASAGVDGVNGHAGALVSVFYRNSDTDEDGRFYAAATIGTVSTDGLDNTDTFTSVPTGTYAVYVRWLYNVQGGLAAGGGLAVGPVSARADVVVT